MSKLLPLHALGFYAWLQCKMMKDELKRLKEEQAEVKQWLDNNKNSGKTYEDFVSDGEEARLNGRAEGRLVVPLGKAGPAPRPHQLSVGRREICGAAAHALALP